MAKAIYFDMDGTLADLYAVDDWLGKLQAEDVSPYVEARCLLNMQALAHRLNTLQRKGYRIGVISWLCLGGSAEYGEAVTAAKLKWLAKHLGSVSWDEVHIVEYGMNKSELAGVRNGYLFDDNADVRREWQKGNRYGWAFDASSILSVLELLG